MHLESTVTRLDSDLVGRARARDAGAWRTIVQAHKEPVFRLALLLTGDATDAAEVAQETFISAYRHLDRFDGERPLLSPFAYTSRLPHPRAQFTGDRCTTMPRPQPTSIVSFGMRRQTRPRPQPRYNDDGPHSDPVF